MNRKSKNINIPLFWKFAIILSFVIIIFGSINIHLLWNSVYNSFDKEINKRCTVLAKIVAEKSLSPLVFEDYLTLHEILDEIKESDPSISYAFILDGSDEIVAHTYDLIIPKDLISINKPNAGKANIQVIQTNNFEYPVIRDIAYPILNSDVGVVRLGIVEDQIHDEIMRVTYRLVIMIIAFFLIGLIGAFFFSYLITSPIKNISNKLQIIDLKNLENEDYSIPDRKRFKIFNFVITDETDILVSKLTDMIFRLKRSRVELKESQESLVQADKLAALGTLSAGVAHEVNNPISGIKNCINRINRNPENIKQNSEYILLIKEAINKIEGVMSHLLSFSRKQNIVLSKIDINRVIENAIDLTKHELQTKDVSIKLDYSESNLINGSSNHLEQVFVNLILNSLDAIIEKREKDKSFQAEIIITVKRVKNRIIVHVSDNGIGIPDKSKDKIFDPFYTSKADGKGTGLGLSVSYNIIEKHRGDISFTSQIGIGTEFIIELPSFDKK